MNDDPIIIEDVKGIVTSSSAIIVHYGTDSQFFINRSLVANANFMSGKSFLEFSNGSEAVIKSNIIPLLMEDSHD